MHDIWNPWHGCVKCSEGCEHCYMYFLDRMRDHDGGENVFFNVTCKNQHRADERIPLLLELPFKHKGIMCAPSSVR